MSATAIDHIHYDRASERLTVTFANGRTHEYFDVPPEVAASFQATFSKALFFNGYIRDRYDFRELVSAH